MPEEENVRNEINYKQEKSVNRLEDHNHNKKSITKKKLQIPNKNNDKNIRNCSLNLNIIKK